MIEFQAWPKTPRFNRTVWVTEKIDGTNAAVVIRPAEETAVNNSLWFRGETFGWAVEYVEFAAQSRKRLIHPDNDNFAFANWAYGNAETLIKGLGMGTHFGEWWGHGIQRGYGLARGDNRFSLFNVGRWFNKLPDELPDEVNTVPVLYVGQDPIEGIQDSLQLLRDEGSKAVLDGFDKPEGVIVHFSETRQNYKILIDRDDLHKGQIAMSYLENEPRGFA